MKTTFIECSWTQKSDPTKKVLVNLSHVITVEPYKCGDSSGTKITVIPSGIGRHVLDDRNYETIVELTKQLEEK